MKPDALQRLLALGSGEGQPKPSVWQFDQKRSRKNLANMVNAPDKKPAWDVQTRWNSTYIMLELALQLKDAIIRYAELDKTYSFCPSDQNWDHVKALHGHLKVFYDSTLRLSGAKYPTLNLYFPDFCEKWNKYWEIGSVLLALACSLDPRCKLAVVEYYFKMLHPEELQSFMTNLKTCFDDLFNEYLISNNKQPQSQSQSSQSTAPSSSGSKDETDSRAGFKNFLNDKKQADPILSELDQYLSEPLDPCSLDDDFDILSWWKLKAPKYPILSKLARDILAVPISTVASESTFSTAGRTLSPTRSSLNDESIEALVCAQNWLRTAVIESGGELGDADDDAIDEIIE
ncbi:Zinc finger BED domain-containing protein RICESLEEPER 4 [Rhynchospora pubera]|uniref:Zinc finger BED domain-containing protein RICESLEEPER 4 n=1 Tax=Rhynchospora pubera TaxID=906938 RepID=A0AAV8BTS4_9POAL|nr:Zinc finger BED domain-containing protein RICESLEEPER 4 [Rhynchospora pubera]